LLLEGRANPSKSAVEAHSEVIAINTHFFANLVFILFFEKIFAKDLLVGRSKVNHDAPNDALALFAETLRFSTGGLVGRFDGVFGHLLKTGAGAEEFRENVFADGVDKSTQALGMLDAALIAEDIKDTQKGFLAGIFDQLRRTETAAEFDE